MAVYLGENEISVGVYSKQELKLQEKSVKENGDVFPDEGYNGLSKVVVDVQSNIKNSGGKYLIRVIDYDGTILKEDHLDTGAIFTLPEIPTNHSQLVFQEWSSTTQITNNTVTVGNNDIIIGAIYTTVSGLSEFDITLTKKTGLLVILNMDGTKDWGDGTSDTNNSHTYTKYGNYTITCDGTTMTTSDSSGLFGQKSGSNNFYCTNVRLGNVTSISMYAFSRCGSLTNITIPNNVTIIEDHPFDGCSSLENIIIPNNVTEVGTCFCQYCYSLKNVVLPKGFISFSIYDFRGCSSLKNIVLPDGFTGLGQECFYNCYSLKKVIYPSTVTTVSLRPFSGCHCLIEQNFSKHTRVPNLSGTAGFIISYIGKIYVPDNLYDEWRAAINWSSIADYIYKVSEMEN